MLKSLFLISLFCAISFSAVAQDCPRIFQRGDTLFTDPAPQYQWFRDNEPLNGATKQWFLPASKGNYRVEVRNTAPKVGVSLDLERTITGRVVDERYEPIADATVSVGQVNVKSDAKGFFRLEKVKILTENAVVAVNKAGFWKNVQRVHFFTPQEATLTAMLETLRITNRFDAQKGATISERGFFLTFPPNSAVTESGQVYQGTINLSLKRAFPSEDGFGLRMPGGDFSAIDANGQEKILVSYGFMSAEMQGANGEKLNLAPDTEATLEFYIPWEQNKTAPESMPLWHFDETAGVWKPEGTARKVGPRYVGTVKHFSSWNCDIPWESATVKGKVVDCKGNPIPNKVVRIGKQLAVATNDVGVFYGRIPQGVSFGITAGIDTIVVNPLTAGEVKDIGSLQGIRAIYALGIIDSSQTLSVYGYRVYSYSIDNGINYHPKTKKLKITTNEFPKWGLVRDSLSNCTTKFPIIIRPKQGDCQLLDSANLAPQIQYNTLNRSVFRVEEVVYKMEMALDFKDTDFELIANSFPCLQELSFAYWTCRSGYIPESIGQLTNLQSLKVNDNFLNALPESIGQLTWLESLMINNCKIRILPKSITQLTNLKRLDYRDNGFSVIPDSITQLTSLISLDLSGNGLKTIPTSISRLGRLQYLNLAFNKIVSLPNTIGQLTHLQTLNLERNQLDALPQFIPNLTNLKSLIIGGNQFSEMPTVITMLSGLESLDISGSQWLWFIPESIQQMTALRSLNLSASTLYTLPKGITHLRNLEKLDVANNKLDSLPESMGQLSNLTELILRNNKLTNLPPTIANLKDTLKTLSLSGNPIPEEEKAKIRSWLPNTQIAF